jgi:EmrB/QacA subfamily drug resistance transporter
MDDHRMVELEYKKRIILLIVSLALFMEALDTTIINTAIPAISHSLNVDPLDLKIALISYLLSLAIFIPISGWIADKFGIKRVFISALFIFSISSIWCGFATNLFHLVAARTLQGIGGSFMLPLGRLIIVRTFQRHELIVTMNRVVMVGASGLMLGPVLGGVITHYFSWHWIFWVNIPVSLLTIIMALYWLEEAPPQAVSPLDKIGFVLFGSGLAGLTFGLSALSETTIHRGLALQVISAAILLLAGYLWYSSKQPHPIVKTELFASRTFQVSVLGNLFSRLGFGGMPFLLPLMLQIGLKYSAQLSGLLLAPMALGILFVKPFSLRLLRLLGYKRLLTVNTILVAASLWMFTIIDGHTSVYFIAFLTFIFGFVISIQYSGMNSLAYADISAENLSAATSVMSTMQQLAQSFGVAISALLIRYFVPTHSLENFNLPLSVFRYTFFTLGILTLFSILIFKRLKLEDGSQMITSPI